MQAMNENRERFETSKPADWFQGFFDLEKSAASSEVALVLRNKLIEVKIDLRFEDDQEEVARVLQEPGSCGHPVLAGQSQQEELQVVRRSC